MPDDTIESPDHSPIDTEVLARIAAHLARSGRFDDVATRPTYAPNAVSADYNLGYFPGGITRAYLQIRWFEADDFSIHYSEQYQSGNSWKCRWDRHTNNHNTREHFHPPPDVPTPGDDTNYPNEWRGVLSTVLTHFVSRIKRYPCDCLSKI